MNKEIFNKINFPKKINTHELYEFFKSKKLNNLNILSKERDRSVNEYFSEKEFKPELLDLYRLYKFITLNNRTTVMEFGAGYSTLIFNIALNENRKKFSSEIKKLRRNNPFELFTIDNDRAYIKKTEKKINIYQNKYFLSKSKINYHYSEVEMVMHNNRIATQYKTLPMCNPDFIYIDGPSQFGVKNKINGISTCHIDMMPMLCDVLKIEYFLTPGTIIVTDGRGANAKFIKDNLKRDWLYIYQEYFDQHIFYLNDQAIGPYNKLQLKFYKNKI